MPTKQRKIEVHRLTISGLPDGTPYGRFLKNLRGQRPGTDMVMKAGDKSHALMYASVQNRRLRMQFISFTKGHRPDVLDTNHFALQRNPMAPTQTHVEWTHVMGGKRGGQYILLIEKNISGIYPSTIGYYIQWMLDRFYDPPAEEEGGDDEPATVNMEAEPGPEFLSRIESLDRVTEAVVRVVRPNPGWRDLESELGEKAGESDARKVDVVMTARRGSSLRRSAGIVEWIRDAFRARDLGYAAVKGWRGGQRDNFNTEKLGKHTTVALEMDDQGQIVSSDAWERMAEIMDNLD